MKLELKRTYFGEDYTIGKLYINDEYFCDTLEDKVRPDGVKVYGETAIPSGKYKVIMNMSNRFKKIMPLLLNVPNFEGIRIHSGNTDVDTHGCLLLGKNTIKGKVTDSKNTCSRFYALLAIALKSEECWITIE